MHYLHVLCQCCQEGAVPQDTKNAKIITLIKNKRERSHCNDYGGISLLSIIGKVFAKVILTRLQKLAERVYAESQCGFRAGRPTIDTVFSLLQLQKKCREQQMPPFIAFADLPAITIDDYELDVVEQFIHLGSTITDNLSLDTEIDKTIGKAATTVVASLHDVDQHQTDSEDKDGSAQCLCRQHTDVRQRHVDHIRQTGEKTQFLPPEKHPSYPGQDRVSNIEVLSPASLPSMFTLLRQRRLRWLGHACHMEDGHIP